MSGRNRREYNKAYYLANKDKMNEQSTAWRKAHLAEDRLRVKEYHFRTAYGLTLEQRDEMYKEQSGRCAICGQFNETLAVDHNHNTGGVRNLLCGRCNRVLGNVHESVELLSAMIDYLDEWSGQ